MIQIDVKLRCPRCNEELTLNEEPVHMQQYGSNPYVLLWVNPCQCILADAKEAKDEKQRKA